MRNKFFFGVVVVVVVLFFVFFVFPKVHAQQLTVSSPGQILVGNVTTVPDVMVGQVNIGRIGNMDAGGLVAGVHAVVSEVTCNAGNVYVPDQVVSDSSVNLVVGDTV